jgi:hypothetical protein
LLKACKFSPGTACNHFAILLEYNNTPKPKETMWDILFVLDIITVSISVDTDLAATEAEAVEQATETIRDYYGFDVSRASEIQVNGEEFID